MEMVCGFYIQLFVDFGVFSKMQINASLTLCLCIYMF